MARLGCRLLLSLFLCCFVYPGTNGDYVITTPREVIRDDSNQMCVFVTDPNAPEGQVDITLEENRHRGDRKILLNTTLQVPAGKVEFCRDLNVSNTGYSRGLYKLNGTLSGKPIRHSGKVTLKSKVSEKVFIETDKHVYKAGQTVQFRILTVTGPELKVLTRNYPEVWVETPSKTRIAQWLDVDNSQGIVQLSMQLVDEPEEGFYNIRLRSSTGGTKNQGFKVEEFVLPRYELTFTPPSYVLPTDEYFSFTVCARYTFGQPVKGNVTLKLSNEQDQLCRSDITRMENMTGCQSFEFSVQELQVLDCDVHRISVDITFEEEGTGVPTHNREGVSITRRPINFRQVYADKHMKPNIPMTIKVKAELPDGSPASNIHLEVCAAGRCNNMTTPSDGIITAVMPVYKANRIIMKNQNSRAALEASSYSKDIDHFFSPSNSSLLIYAPEEELKCRIGEPISHTLPVLFAATNQTSALIRLQVISRGRIQYWESKEYQLTASDLPINAENLVEPLPSLPAGSVRGVLNIPLSLPSTATPTAKILVWYTREDGEVVSDAAELRIEKCLPNSANLTWAIQEGQPGDETTVSLSSKPQSVCSLGVVDRSTLLLSRQSDPVTLESLFNLIRRFFINTNAHQQVDDYEYCKLKHEEETLATVGDDTVYRFFSLYSDSISMFDDSGLYIFTDQTVNTRPCEKEEEVFTDYYLDDFESAIGFQSRPVSFAPSSEGGVGGGADAAKESSEPRTDFPETWLWDIVVVPPSGVHTQQVTLPDTITEWVGKAVCAHPEDGIGLSQETSVTTFLPFFVDLTLPYSIKRGEILPVKISVFNYLDQELPVTVRLHESPEYEILEDALRREPVGQRTSCIAAQDKVVHSIRINALSLGDVNLTISAFVDHDSSLNCGNGNSSVTRSDAIIKPIKVEPEGYPREKTWTKYICSQDFETGEDSLEVWEVAPPAVIVEGSDRGWVSSVGDLLALSLENLGHLIRMPYGCGEQNMLNFAPNIFIMKYLQATKQNTTESTEKLIRFMTTGYRRELVYRHPDGSFSAFGTADDSGSTWLTAFVLKSFAQAQPYILVDKAQLNKTRTWLQTYQDPEGCFLSIGKVFLKGMRKDSISAGGNSSIPLSTYVMISLLEAGEDPKSPTIAQAKSCILSNDTQDPYTLALKAYALALANFPEAENVTKQLLGLATSTQRSLHWELPQSPRKGLGVELETAAYAVLAMLEQDYETYKQDVRKVVKWITTKRNGRGGFYSTQDTVMALQALARFETFQFQGDLNVTTTVAATNLSHTFNVVESNRLLQQLVNIPTFPTNVTLGMEGQGCAVLQAVLRYNIPDPEPSDAFDLTVNTRTEVDIHCVTKRITACASYRLPDEKSNMAVIEVNLVSGYIPEKDDLKNLVKEFGNVVKRYEVDGDKVSFYIEELSPESTCINFRAVRAVDVENVKPGTVVVYDYYQPEFSISESYTLPPADECRY